LTYQLPPGADGRDVTAASPISGPPQPDPGNVRARRIVFTVTAACVALMVAAVAVAAARRRTR